MQVRNGNGLTTSLRKYFALLLPGGFVRLLGGGVSPLARALLSKVVEPDEAGKMFSCLLPLETLLGTAIYPVCALVYNATIETLPSAYNFVIAGIFGAEILMAL